MGLVEHNYSYCWFFWTASVMDLVRKEASKIPSIMKYLSAVW